MGDHARAEAGGGSVKPASDGKHAAPAAAFWRLLGDYERISRDETTAIRGEDFETAATIQALKAVLFATLENTGRDLGIDRRQASFDERLEKIASGERANQAFVKQLLARNIADRKTLEIGRAHV